VGGSRLQPQHQQDLMFWGFVLIGVVIVGAFGIMLIKRWLKNQEGAPTEDAGFSLSELRAMRDRGEITPEEYEQTRSRVISKVKAMTNSPRGKKEPLGGASDRFGPPAAPAEDEAR
jgi:hypothetical protein